MRCEEGRPSILLAPVRVGSTLKSPAQLLAGLCRQRDNDGASHPPEEYTWACVHTLRRDGVKKKISPNRTAPALLVLPHQRKGDVRKSKHTNTRPAVAHQTREGYTEVTSRLLSDRAQLCLLLACEREDALGVGA